LSPGLLRAQEAIAEKGKIDARVDTDEVSGKWFDVVNNISKTKLTTSNRMTTNFTNRAIRSTKPEVYEKNVQQLAMDSFLHPNDWEILGCADIKYKSTRKGRVTGRQTNVIQMARSAGMKATNDEYRVLMAMKNKKRKCYGGGTVSFVMLKRPEVYSKHLLYVDNPLRNRILETNFMNDIQGGILNSNNVKIGRNEKVSMDDYDCDYHSSSDEWREEKEETDSDSPAVGMTIFTIENTDTLPLPMQLWKTIYKIQILDTSDDPKGGWDGKKLTKVMLDLANKE